MSIRRTLLLGLLLASAVAIRAQGTPSISVLSAEGVYKIDGKNEVRGTSFTWQAREGMKGILVNLTVRTDGTEPISSAHFDLAYDSSGSEQHSRCVALGAGPVSGDAPFEAVSPGADSFVEWKPSGLGTYRMRLLFVNVPKSTLQARLSYRGKPLSTFEIRDAQP
jgi:hypothetical protein